MKNLLAIALLAASITSVAQQTVSQSSGAATAAASDPAHHQNAACQNYSTTNCVPCENGSGNRMCQTVNATCDTGATKPAVSYSSFDTSTCTSSSSTNSGTGSSAAANCAQQPESCSQLAPRAGACPGGLNWVIPPDQVRPFYSHYISVCAPTCLPGQTLSFATTPPSCTTITCPSNQVVIGNSCACPSALPVMVGTTCTAATPPPCNATPVNGSAVTCAAAGYAGYSGTAYQLVYTTYGGSTSCSPATTGSYSAGTCTAPACNTGASNGIAVSCATAGYPGYTGTGYQKVYTTYNNTASACTQAATGGYGIGTCTQPTPNCNATPTVSGSVTCAVAGYAGYVGSGTSLVYTAYTSGGACNQVSAGYGIGTCTAPTPACNTGAANGGPVSCAAAGYPGYTGTAYQKVFTTYNSTATTCTQTPTGGYGIGSCTLPNCNSGASTGGTVSCATAGYSGYVGTAYKLVYTTYGGGTACNQIATGSYAIGTCVPACTVPSPNPAVSTSTCPTGYSGTITNTTTYSCSTGTLTSTTTQSSTCEAQTPVTVCTAPKTLEINGICYCPNGANNATCTLTPDGCPNWQIITTAQGYTPVGGTMRDANGGLHTCLSTLRWN